MATSYTLRFSDLTNPNTIEVLGTTLGPGKNNYSTSLDLVGPGYSNYGLDTAQNFLKLLENFAGPNSPQNAIKGQLWYDTSNPARGVLRVNNGDLTSNRWPAATGIYQQNNDPAISYSEGVTVGDIWVDTGSNQMKIRDASGWTIVGPNVQPGFEKSGSEVQILTANTIANDQYPVILNWVNGKVVEIIAYNEFTPRTVIDGFTSLKPGTNLTSRVSARYNGIAEKASSIYVSQTETILATEILKNKSLTSAQVHTGEFVVESVNGFKVRHPTNATKNTIETKIVSTDNSAYLQYRNTTTDSTLQVGIGNSDTGSKVSYLKFNSNGTIGVNKTPSALYALDINGSAAVSGVFVIANTGTSALTVGGNATFSKAVTVNTLTVNTVAAFADVVTLGSIGGSDEILIPAANDQYDIGSSTNAFRQLYVSKIGSTGTHVTIYGSVSTATQLEVAQSFSVIGHMATVAPVSFDGTADVVLDLTATQSLITATNVTTSTTATQTLLVYDSGVGLSQIQKSNFLSDVYAQIFQTGMIVPWGSATAPTDTKASGEVNWLVCNGDSKSTAAHPYLYNAIGYRYGGSGPSFKIPNMSTSTYVSTGTNTGTYVTYIIKT